MDIEGGWRHATSICITPMRRYTCADHGMLSCVFICDVLVLICLYLIITLSPFFSPYCRSPLFHPCSSLSFLSVPSSSPVTSRHSASIFRRPPPQCSSSLPTSIFPTSSFHASAVRRRHRRGCTDCHWMVVTREAEKEERGRRMERETETTVSE